MAASDGKTIAIKLTATTDDLESGLKRGTTAVKSWAAGTQDSIAAVEQSTEKMARLWRSAFEAFIGVEVIKALKGIALGAADAESALQTAATTAANFGKSINVNSLEKWLEGFAKSAQAGGVALTDLRASVQQFASIGLGQAQIERAVADAANLAAARHISLAEATKVVTYALTGHVEMLTRYGIISREAAKNVKTTEEAMNLLEKATKGAAERAAVDPIAAFGRLTNAVDLFRDHVGHDLQPIMTEIANAATHVVEALDHLSPAFIRMASQAIVITGSLVTLVLLLPAVWKGLELIGEGAKLVFGLFQPLVDLVLGLGAAFESAASGEYMFAAGEALAAAGPLLIVAGIAALIAILAVLVTDIKDTKELFVAVWHLMGDSLRLFIAQAEADFAPLIAWFKASIMEVGDVWGALCTFIHDAWKTVTDAVGDMFKGEMDVLTQLLSPVSGAWDKFCGYLSDRFQEFADKLHIQTSQVQNDLQGMMIGGMLAGPLGAVIGGIAGQMKPDQKTKADASEAKSAVDGLLKHARDGFASTMKFVDGLLKPTFGPNAKIPHPAFDNTIPPGKTGDGGAAKAAENALKNLEELIKNKLDDINAIVDKAKNRVDVAKENLTAFDTAHPAGTPMSDADKAQREKLVTEELKAQQALRATMLIQEAAENNAHATLVAYAKEISKHLKDHDQLVRQATDAAREHAKAARDIALQYIEAGTALQQIIAQEKARRMSELATSTTAANQAAENTLSQQQGAAASDEETIQQAIAMLPYGGTGAQGLAWSAPTPQVGKHELQARETITEQSKSGQKSPSLEADRLQVALGELHLAVAQDTLDEKLKIQADDKARAATDKSTEAQQAYIDSTNAVTQAQNALQKASDDLAVAQKKFFSDQQSMWNQLITGLIAKANAPGLGFNAATQSVSFNPMEMLFSAIEQTQMFGDVMNTVTQIVQTFAQMLNALRPVIDALMDVVRAIVNVFIFLYNVVARILDLFGLQIQQLQYLTDAMAGLVPLISIVHEIPTLNELAAGKLNSPLSTQPQGYQNIGQSNNGQNMLMKVVEVLAGILVAMIVMKVFEGMSLQEAVQSTMHLLGIQVGQVRGMAQAQSLSIQEKATATALANKTDGLTQIIGAKAAGLTVTTNSLLTTINGTLLSILAALQTKNIISALSIVGGGGGGGGGADVGVNVGVSGGGGAGPAAQANQALQQLADALDVTTSALMAHEREITASSSIVAKLTENMTNLASSVQSLDRSVSVNSRTDIGSVTLNNGLDLDDLSESLSRSQSRIIRTASKGIDRVPGM